MLVNWCLIWRSELVAPLAGTGLEHSKSIIVTDACDVFSTILVRRKLNCGAGEFHRRSCCVIICESGIASSRVREGNWRVSSESTKSDAGPKFLSRHKPLETPFESFSAETGVPSNDLNWGKVSHGASCFNERSSVLLISALSSCPSVVLG